MEKENDAMHGDDFAAVRERLPDEEVLYDLAELYKIFGDTTRVKLLYILFEGEMCVQHLAELLQVSQSAVSHQLRILKGARLTGGTVRQYIMRWRTIMFVKLSSVEWNILQNSEETNMIKTFKLTELDCPVCANKMQEAVAKIDGVSQARVDFLVMKLTIEAEENDFPRILKQAGKVVRKVEPDCELIEI